MRYDPDDRVITEHERTILAHIANGDTRRACARRMWLAENTIKTHMLRICRALGVSESGGSHGAVREAMTRGYLVFDTDRGHFAPVATSFTDRRSGRTRARARAELLATRDAARV